MHPACQVHAGSSCSVAIWARIKITQTSSLRGIQGNQNLSEALLEDDSNPPLCSALAVPSHPAQSAKTGWKRKAVPRVLPSSRGNSTEKLFTPYFGASFFSSVQDMREGRYMTKSL